ncbi:MAG TPA: diaminobutyrate--2-oxoglutarate transaminase [Longimicrobium sp.]|nr:diaminobutyrate--2-oxoglutarate transaminase [Longimicrobium sp.]
MQRNVHHEGMGMDTFEALESAVRSYCRTFPVVFTSASGATLVDEEGRPYVDLLSGAGALNYGHNPPEMKRAMIEYLEGDGVLHSLDMATAAKRRFLERFDEVVLRPRGLSYRVQFPGPTGTNAVEAALKLARKVTGRQTVACFANAYHGMTLGALAVTGNAGKRRGAGVPLSHALFLPYDGDLGPGVDTLDHFEQMLSNPGSGVELPAAVILETVQAEGGVKVASAAWLRRLERIARLHGILLIVDDIQVGCGRTGDFFSFEEAGIRPDLVCLSKSISGAGLPMALVLIRPDLDAWAPGEHNGTFRGNNLAFVTAAEALSRWENDALSREVRRKEARVTERLGEMAARFPAARAHVRGRGLVQGLVCGTPGVAREASREAFARGVVVETAGPRDEVLKLLPPLTIPDALLERALDIIEESLEASLAAVAGEVAIATVPIGTLPIATVPIATVA